MSTMTHRTTFALDAVTAQRLKRLATLWQVSQAEVVRRAIAQAEADSNPARPDPVALLRDLLAQGLGLDLKKANAYLAEVRTDRKKWVTPGSAA